MKKQFLIFFSIVFSFYGIINIYIYLRLTEVFPRDQFPFINAILIFLIFAYLIGRQLEKKFGGTLTRLIVYSGSMYMALMVYLLLGFLLTEIFFVVNFIFPKSIEFLDMTTKGNRQSVLTIVLVLSFIMTAAGYLNARLVRIKKLNLRINKPGGKLNRLRIAVASDIHLGSIIGPRRVRSLKNKINALNPDLVLFAGDILDEDLAVVIRNDLGSLLKEIKSKYGVYAVNGNHEYIGGIKAADEYLTAHGINLLRDEVAMIEDSFYIIGREDISSGRFAGSKRMKLEELTSGLDKSKPSILMDHQPFNLHEAEENGIDLQLSGHTHHGQLFPFNFITKRVYELSYGYKKKGNTHYYVSCGYGTWGPPIKTTARPEIVLLEITFD